MAINPDGVQCWHTDEHGELDCWNLKRYRCFHCKCLYCEAHTREHLVDGYGEKFCEKCYAALFEASVRK